MIDIDDRIMRPERLLNLFPEHELALSIHQHAQDPQSFPRQKRAFCLRRTVCNANLSRLEVDLKGTEPKSLWRIDLHGKFLKTQWMNNLLRTRDLTSIAGGALAELRVN